MAIYSNSQLSAYEECPLKYRLCYRDRIERETEGIEGFLGDKVHKTLNKCYDDIKFTSLNSLGDLLDYYHKIWQKNWHDSIFITKQHLTSGDYKNLGERLLRTYYERYAPFDSDITIGNELNINFSLDDENKYRMTGRIDRLACTKDGVHEIHDYKTSAYLNSQQDIDNDRQLGLYHIGIQKKWPDIENIRLVWHYLAFNKELISFRSPEAISNLIENTKKLIDEIESAQDFQPKESRLCDWCEYPDLCPRKKHPYMVEALPVNEYLNEPGVVLANKFAELKRQEKTLSEEMQKVREAIIEYAKKEQVEVIKGSDCKVSVRFDEKLKFPGKNEPERQGLENLIKEAGKWTEASQLDTNSLARIIEEHLWDKDLIDKVMKFGRIEETDSVHIAKLKNEE